MAKKVNLIKNGVVKEGYLGFSWTSFFFSFFVPLFRKDWITAGIIFLLSIIVGYFTVGVGSLIWSLLLGFGYNKYYTKNLIEKEGYLPMSDVDSHLLHYYEIFVKNTEIGITSPKDPVNPENTSETSSNDSNKIFTQRIITENIHLTKGEVMNENSKTNQYDVELEKLKLNKSTNDTEYMRNIIEKNATNEHDANISSSNAEVDKLKVDVDKTKTLQGDQESRDKQLHEEKIKLMEMELEKLRLTNGNQETRDSLNSSKNKVALISFGIVTVTLIIGSAIYFKTVNSLKLEREAATQLKQIDNQVEMLKTSQGNQEIRDAQAHEAEMKKIEIAAEQEKIRVQREIEEARKKAENEALAMRIKAQSDAAAAKRKLEAEIAEAKRKNDALIAENKRKNDIELEKANAEKEKEANDFKILNSIINKQ